MGFALPYHKAKRLYENKTHGIEILLPEVKIYKEFCEPKINDYLPNGETRGLVKLWPRLPPGRRDAWTRQIKTAIRQKQEQRRLYTYPDTKDNRSPQRKSSESHEWLRVVACFDFPREYSTKSDYPCGTPNWRNSPVNTWDVRGPDSWDFQRHLKNHQNIWRPYTVRKTQIYTPIP